MLYGRLHMLEEVTKNEIENDMLLLLFLLLHAINA